MVDNADHYFFTAFRHVDIRDTKPCSCPADLHTILDEYFQIRHYPMILAI